MQMNYDMSAAPKDRRILIVRENGDAGIVRFNDQKYHKKPKPFWTDDRDYMPIGWSRSNPPIAWAELPKVDVSKIEILESEHVE